MNDDSMRKATWAMAAALIILSQGPLIWLLAQGHDRETVLQVFRHAPNQFIFLLLFFPVATIASAHLFLRLHDIFRNHNAVALPPVTRSVFWSRWTSVLVAVIALTIVLVDSIDTPPDFYSKKPEVVANAVEWNRALVESGEMREQMADAYKSEEAGTVLAWLEGIELACTAIVAVFIGLACIVGIQLRLRAMGNPTLWRDVRYLAPVLILATLAFAPWCPLRAHNIGEIRLADPGFTTTEPFLVLSLMLIVIVYALIIYYRDLDSVAVAIRKLWGGLIALGGMTAIVWFTQRPSGLGELLQKMSLAGLLLVGVGVFLVSYLLAVLLQVSRSEDEHPPEAG